MKLMDLVVELGTAVNTVLEAQSSPADLQHLIEATEAIEQQRCSPLAALIVLIVHA